MRLTILLACALLGAPLAPHAETRMTDDAQHLWLEEVEGERALAWVREQNARSLAVLQGDARFARFEAEARRVLESEERIADPVLLGDRVYNFWQDATQVRGVLRRTDWESYAAGAPKWETVLDVDALAKAEGRNWVTGMPDCLPPAYRRCLVGLSNGGKDAATVREFDLESKRFVADGFVLPEAKSGVEWRDENTLVVATDWGGDTLTESGYPFVVKLWARGTPLASAREFFRGERRDVGVFPFAFHDPAANAPVVGAIR
jgi:prolyl oligopeptidase